VYLVTEQLSNWLPVYFINSIVESLPWKNYSFTTDQEMFEVFMAVTIQIVVFHFITTYNLLGVRQYRGRNILPHSSSSKWVRLGYIGWLLSYLFSTVPIGPGRVLSSPVPADLGSHLLESCLYNWQQPYFTHLNPEDGTNNVVHPSVLSCNRLVHSTS
jgi:hypothetical protein